MLFLWGGLPENRTTLLTGSSGSAKTIFAIQYLYNGLNEYNDPGVFVSFEETEIDILRNVKSFGWDLQTFQNKNKLLILDASPDAYHTSIQVGGYDFSGFAARITGAVKSMQSGYASIQ